MNKSQIIKMHLLMTASDIDAAVLWRWGRRPTIQCRGHGSDVDIVCVQALTDEGVHALTCLVSLRELSLSGATGISGEGLAALKSLSSLQVGL